MYSRVLCKVSDALQIKNVRLYSNNTFPNKSLERCSRKKTQLVSSIRKERSIDTILQFILPVLVNSRRGARLAVGNKGLERVVNSGRAHARASSASGVLRVLAINVGDTNPRLRYGDSPFAVVF